MPNKKRQIINYNIEQIYLETARAASSMGVVGLYRKPGEPQEINAESSIRFAAVAVSISFAYAAMESFCNAHLHSIYSQLRAGSFKSAKFRDESHKKFFISEKVLKGLLRMKLKDKLQVLASALNIPSIKELDVKFWNEICAISRDMRNFIIHPNPIDFNKPMKKIMQKYPAGKYAEIAEKTIRFFYENRNPAVNIPDWLSKSTLLRFLNSADFKKQGTK